MADALPLIPLRRSDHQRRPLRRVLFRPTAPGLKDPRYGGRAIPAAVMPHVKGNTTVTGTPNGGHLLFTPKKGKALQYEARFLAPGAAKPVKLGTGLTWSPFPHAWSADAAQLFLGSKHELYGVRFPDLEARLIDRRQPGQRFASVAASTHIHATEDSDHFTVRRIADDAVVLQERGAEGLVAFPSERFLLQSSLGMTRLYAVRETAVTLVAYRRELTMGCWNEGGETYINVSTDDGSGNVDSKELVYTHRLGNVDDLYPEEWR